MRILKQSRSVEKCERGPFKDIEKISKCLNAKKIERGTLSSRPVLYVTLKKEQMKGGPFALT